MIGIIPLREISADLLPIQKQMIKTLMIGIFISSILSFLLSYVIVRPIRATVLAMHRFSEGDFEVRLSEERKDEFGEMNRVFNETTRKIEELMHEATNSKLLNKEMEFKALQAQINPHFLYNTLDAIGWLCEEERCQDAVEMVNALAKLFRISISKGHELITIQKEVEHAKSYLKIQNFRYKNQFSYDFQIEEDCLQYYCNKITLQPIIENAIYHGLDRMVDEGHIQIRIYSEGEDVIFRVEDNGVGMSEEQCRSILHKEPGDNSGIGIKNVNDRIKIYFGKEYGLSIESELDVGTCVTIRMPKVEENAAAGWEKV